MYKRQGIAYVRETPAGQRPEVFWASAPDAFEVLGRDKLLAKSADVANKDVPDKIGNYPINDPGGMYLGDMYKRQGMHFGAQLAEHVRRDVVGGAMGGVHHDRHAVQVEEMCIRDSCTPSSPKAACPSAASPAPA